MIKLFHIKKYKVIKADLGLFLVLLFISVLFIECNKDNTVPDIPEDLPMHSISNPPINKNPVVDYNLWEIKNGKFYLEGKWVFLKIAKPIRDFSSMASVHQLIADLDILRSKYYNTIEINCYWHHFDTNGDGVPDKSLEPLNRLINAIYEKGMYPCLSVETYSVGGGQLPKGFWATNPDAYAIDDKGNKVKDTEYGFGTNVVSIFHSGYRKAAGNILRVFLNISSNDTSSFSSISDKFRKHSSSLTLSFIFSLILQSSVISLNTNTIPDISPVSFLIGEHESDI